MDEPFTTDRRSVVSDLDQSACCIKHDWAYWKGGPKEDRRTADAEFFNCIWETSKFPILAPIRWLGVRIGGKKFWRVPRIAWNYGWKDFEWRDEDGPITEASQRPVLLKALKKAEGEVDQDSDAANA